MLGGRRMEYGRTRALAGDERRRMGVERARARVCVCVCVCVRACVRQSLWEPDWDGDTTLKAEKGMAQSARGRAGHEQ